MTVISDSQALPSFGGSFANMYDDTMRCIFKESHYSSFPSMASVNIQWHLAISAYCHDVVSQRWPAVYEKYITSGISWIKIFVKSARLADNISKGIFKASILTFPNTKNVSVIAIGNGSVAINRSTNDLLPLYPQQFKKQLDVVRSSDGYILRSIEIKGPYCISDGVLYMANNEAISAWNLHTGKFIESFGRFAESDGNGEPIRVWADESGNMFVLTCKQGTHFRYNITCTICEDLFTNPSANYFGPHVEKLFFWNKHSKVIQELNLWDSEADKQANVIQLDRVYGFESDGTTLTLVFRNNDLNIERVRGWDLTSENDNEETVREGEWYLVEGPRARVFEHIGQVHHNLEYSKGIIIDQDEQHIQRIRQITKDGVPVAENPGFDRYGNFAFSEDGKYYFTQERMFVQQPEGNEDPIPPVSQLSVWDTQTGEQKGIISNDGLSTIIQPMQDQRVITFCSHRGGDLEIKISDFASPDVKLVKNRHVNCPFVSEPLTIDAAIDFDGEMITWLQCESDVNRYDKVCVLDFSTKESDKPEEQQVLEESIEIHADDKTMIGVPSSKQGEDILFKSGKSESFKVTQVLKKLINRQYSLITKTMRYVIYVVFVVTAVAFVLIANIFQAVWQGVVFLSRRICCLNDPVADA